MPTTVVRYQTKDDRSDENQQLVEAVFAALHRDQPTGFGYTVLRIADDHEAVTTRTGTLPATR